MKREVMTWAGPPPPGLLRPSDDTGEAWETLTFAGALPDGSRSAEPRGTRETLQWTGPPPPEGWTPLSHKAGEIANTAFSRSRRAEAKA
jgi:hypothetical protein